MLDEKQNALEAIPIAEKTRVLTLFIVVITASIA